MWIVVRRIITLRNMALYMEVVVTPPPRSKMRMTHRTSEEPANLTCQNSGTYFEAAITSRVQETFRCPVIVQLELVVKICEEAQHDARPRNLEIY